ncbi:hypothetical protein ACJMK2_035659 [Sinanodonta woodiana]|uniref:Temptin Cys/Cys disulfide domain-containing protein n=1 Tax=Sinanodonta woodiana TaxID=1069815 RepID=A0ABD3WZK4_SINWO
MSHAVTVLTLLLSTVALVRGHGQYRQYLPNRGEHVTCDGQEWPAVGHMYPLPQGGSFPRNPFGLEFRQLRVMDEDPNSSYRPQYQTLCQRDSDGDGVSNGQELGDADCDGVLDQNLNNDRLGHPGFCEARRGRCGNGASYCPNSQGAQQGSQFGDQFGGAQSQATNIQQSQNPGFNPQVSNQGQSLFPSQQLQLPSQQFFTQQPLQQIASQAQQSQFSPQQSQQPIFQQDQQSHLFPPQPQQQQVPQAPQQQFFPQQPPQQMGFLTQQQQQFAQQPQQLFPQQPQQQFAQQPQQLFPQQSQQQFPQQPQQQFLQQPQQQFPQQPQQQFPQQVQERFPQQPQQQFQSQGQFLPPQQQQRLQQPQNQFMFPNSQTQGISPRQRFDQGPVSTDTFQSQGVIPWWNWPS